MGLLSLDGGIKSETADANCSQQAGGNRGFFKDARTHETIHSDISRNSGLMRANAMLPFVATLNMSPYEGKAEF